MTRKIGAAPKSKRQKDLEQEYDAAEVDDDDEDDEDDDDMEEEDKEDDADDGMKKRAAEDDDEDGGAAAKMMPDAALPRIWLDDKGAPTPACKHDKDFDSFKKQLQLFREDKLASPAWYICLWRSAVVKVSEARGNSSSSHHHHLSSFSLF